MYKVMLTTIVDGDAKAPFSIATSPWSREGRYSFPWITPFTLEPYPIMSSVKQRRIKYYF